MQTQNGNVKKNDATIAVTGATGMLGGHLVAALLAEGLRPVLLVRDRRRLGRLERTLGRYGLEAELATLEIRQTALNNPVALREALRGTGLLYHCAALVGFEPRQQENMIRVNTEIASHVVNAALEGGIRLVHVSSIATLGDSAAGKTMIDEQCLPENAQGKSPYGIGKFFAENEVWRGIKQGLRAVIVNPGIILGEGEWEAGSAQLIPLALRNPFYTTGTKGYVDVRDVARAMILLAAEEQALGHRFILSGANLSFGELFGMIREAAGKRPPKLKAGAGILRAAAALEKPFSRITGRERSLTDETIANAVERSFYDGSAVTRLGGFSYTPIRETIRRVTRQYLREQTAKP